MSISKLLKVTAGALSVAALAGISIVNVNAQDTTVTTLDIAAGALTMYAGDDDENNDLCETGNTTTGNVFQGDDGSDLATINCSATEQLSVLSGLSVTSARQITQAPIHDILFEDLSGSGQTTYAVSATIGDLINQGDGSNITLGSNPDGFPTSTGSDTQPTAPAGTNNGLIYANLDPSAGLGNSAGIGFILPNDQVRDAGNTALFSAGAATAVIDTSTSIGVFSSSGPALAGRYDLDGARLTYRIPAFPDADSYQGSIIFTVVAS